MLNLSPNIPDPGKVRDSSAVIFDADGTPAGIRINIPGINRVDDVTFASRKSAPRVARVATSTSQARCAGRVFWWTNRRAPSDCDEVVTISYEPGPTALAITAVDRRLEDFLKTGRLLRGNDGPVWFPQRMVV